MSEAAEQKVLQYLYDAHATELMVAQTLTGHIAITPSGDYRDLLEQHLKTTRDHAERIQRHLSRRERERGFIQVGYGIAQGVFSQVVAMGKLPVDLVRGMSGEEMLLKNARDECANEAMEIAQYLAIEELATAVDDTATARLAASIRKDEEQMLERLQQLIPRLASDVVRAEVDGNPRFDLRHIGAVDAARGVAGSAARALSRSAGRAGRKAEQSRRATRRAPSPTPKSASAASSTAKSSTSSSRASGTTRKASTKRSTSATKRTGTGTAKRTPAKRSTTKSSGARSSSKS